MAKNDEKPINFTKYELSDDNFMELFDNLEPKVPSGYITIEGNNARKNRQKPSEIKKAE